MHPIEHPFFGRGRSSEEAESTSDGGPVVNGLLVSSAGPFVKRVNGVSASFMATIAGDARGLLVGGLLTAVERRFVGVSGGLMNNALEGDGLMMGAWTGVVDLHGVQIGAVNRSVQTRGVQLGLYNVSRTLRGLQLGLLNRTPERILPLVNWRF